MACDRTSKAQASRVEPLAGLWDGSAAAAVVSAWGILEEDIYLAIGRNVRGGCRSAYRLQVQVLVLLVHPNRTWTRGLLYVCTDRDPVMLETLTVLYCTHDCTMPLAHITYVDRSTVFLRNHRNILSVLRLYQHSYIL